MSFQNPECEKLLELRRNMIALLESNFYIAKSDYLSMLDDARDTISFFRMLKKSGVADVFCMKNDIKEGIINETLKAYDDFDKFIDKKNEQFIRSSLENDKEYFDEILKEVDPEIVLDEDQRRVVLTDEDYCLVIAGAGAGKTTTVAAKVKYLVERKGIDPKQILIVSFTNKAVGELKEKINNALGIDCPIATFHSTGNAILRKRSSEPLNIAESNKLYFVLQDYFKHSILKNAQTVDNLIMFFSSYFDAPYEGSDLNEFFNKVAKGNYSTLKSDLNDFKQELIDKNSKRTQTILNEVLRSYQEVEIANFLYLNGIDYTYEPIYEYNILYARKPYTPDFRIEQDGKVAYLEHFGISEYGTNNRYSSAEISRYKKAIFDKIDLHKKHGTKLIYTYSEYKDRRSLLDHLKDFLLNSGFELRQRSNNEILEKLVSSEESRYIRKLIALITRFIHNFKVNGYELEDFDRMYYETQNVRSRLFINICKDCYIEYQRYLKENNAVDFEDMINESAKLLLNVKEMKQKLDFKYVIVDEYQDISRQRFDLVSALHEVTDAKIVAVGDDWQSIYAFSGSDITLFTHFAEQMGYAKQLKIRRTYRNAQEVIDIAGGFIQENDAQIKKDLISPKSIDDPVIIYTYDNTPKKHNADRRSGANYNLALAVQTCLEQIVKYNETERKKNGHILLLGRFGFDGDALEKTGLFEFVNREGKLRSNKYPKLDITFMTTHASKGLGYDNVIVVNGKNETYGFPSKIEDDPVLAFVIKGDRSIDYAEERRLFYVAMTRTKNRVYFVAPQANPSEFLLELKKKYKNVDLRGEWDEKSDIKASIRQKCPICGYPLQYRYKNAYGLKLWLCTNEPELCGFMTNDLSGEKLSIIKCDKCQSGYLIVKRKRKNNSCFLGCTNYSQDGKGCNNMLSKESYYSLFNLLPVTSEGKPHKKESVERKNAVTNSVPGKENKTKPIAVDKTLADSKIRKADIPEVLYKSYDLNTVVYTILCGLNHISEKRYYGIEVLITVLRGGDTQKVSKWGLDKVPEYGAFEKLPKSDLKVIIDWMLEKHLMLRTNHPMYPVLHPTPEGNDYSNNISQKMLIALKKRLTSGIEE